MQSGNLPCHFLPNHPSILSDSTPLCFQPLLLKTSKHIASSLIASYDVLDFYQPGGRHFHRQVPKAEKIPKPILYSPQPQPHHTQRMLTRRSKLCKRCLTHVVVLLTLLLQGISFTPLSKESPSPPGQNRTINQQQHSPLPPFSSCLTISPTNHQTSKRNINTTPPPKPA